MMDAKQTRTLKIVSEPTTPREPELCVACEAARQLEYVRMLLQAALIAASKPIGTHNKGKS